MKKLAIAHTCTPTTEIFMQRSSVNSLSSHGCAPFTVLSYFCPYYRTLSR